MNEQNNELNDIILNRDKKDGTRKKMLIGVGTLTAVAISIIFIMGRMSDSTPTQLPRPDLVTEQPKSLATEEITPAPAAEPAAAAAASDAEAEQQLDAITERIKEEAQPAADEAAEMPQAEPVPEPEPAAEPVKKPVVQETPKPVKTPAPKSSGPAVGDIYIQVASLSRSQPDKRFLAAIKRSGYAYTLYPVTFNGKTVNKLLVGPFKNRQDAKTHLGKIRREIESNAFIYTIKP